VDWSLTKGHIQWQALVLASLALVPEIRVINLVFNVRKVGYRSVTERETVEKLLEINRDVKFLNS
jgi:hypothetical protein